MPFANANSVRLNYEVLGDKGPPRYERNSRFVESGAGDLVRSANAR
jgi:hypothetical protein